MNEEILKIARVQIGEFLSDLLKEREISLYRLERETKLNKYTIRSVLQGANYNIDSLLTISNYLNLHLKLFEKTLKNSIIGMTGDVPVN